jgi:hypothetical protein
MYWRATTRTAIPPSDSPTLVPSLSVGKLDWIGGSGSRSLLLSAVMVVMDVPPLCNPSIGEHSAGQRHLLQIALNPLGWVVLFGVLKPQSDVLFHPRSL